MYQEHRPNILLTPFVETYWTFDGFVVGEQSIRILPDGCVDILFLFNYSEACPSIVGTMTSYLEVPYSGKVSMLGIRFKPAGITAFTRVSVHEFTNTHTDINLVDTLFDKQFYDVLPEKISKEERLRYIDTYFIAKLSSVYQPEKQIVFAVDLIQRTNGHLSLPEVASQACLSLRHFERKFKTSIGISPKMFSKIMKFKQTIKYIEAHPDESLFTAAIHCGYYDHAHLTKEFQAFSGHSPSYYKG